MFLIRLFLMSTIVLLLSILSLSGCSKQKMFRNRAEDFKTATVHPKLDLPAGSRKKAADHPEAGMYDIPQ